MVIAANLPPTSLAAFAASPGVAYPQIHTAYTAPMNAGAIAGAQKTFDGSMAAKMPRPSTMSQMNSLKKTQPRCAPGGA